MSVLSCSIELVKPETWLPGYVERYWTPNLMNVIGEPLEKFWDASPEDFNLMLTGRVHRTKEAAAEQQVAINKALYFLLG